MIRVLGAILAIGLAATPPSAIAQPAPADAVGQAPAPLYICIYRVGPAWQAGKPLSAQDLGPHTAFIKRLLGEGRLFAGGRMLDMDGGMAIVRAASAEEARAIFAVDPGLTSGLFVAEFHTWQAGFDSGKPLRP